jgi:hypothetical protein
VRGVGERGVPRLHESVEHREHLLRIGGGHRCPPKLSK